MLPAAFRICKNGLAPISAVVAATFLAVVPASADQFTTRDGGPTEAEMLARGGGAPAERLDFFRPVLSGVLFRAGFKGGDKGRTGLDDGQREALCEAGFSGARYVDFGKNTHFGETDCDAGRFDYKAARSTGTSDLMREIHGVIKDPGKGPVLVHCMWGVHSSGAVSAMALIQFCGWSEARAKAYWDKARNGAGCAGGCDKWIDSHFASFKVDPALSISDAERAAICPK